MEYTKIEQSQKTLCSQYGAQFLSTPLQDKVGFASETAGLKPINGLRHPASAGTSGWYIWCGESFSKSADFFSPLHASHIYKEMPGLSRLLGLPPGYRFLLAGEYLDVWYDEKLLAV
jgi:hypothetical protein